jgi:hypothetical protein
MDVRALRRGSGRRQQAARRRDREKLGDLNFEDFGDALKVVEIDRLGASEAEVDPRRRRTHAPRKLASAHPPTCEKCSDLFRHQLSQAGPGF